MSAASFGGLAAAPSMPTSQQNQIEQHQQPVSGLDALAVGSQYMLQQMQEQNRMQSNHPFSQPTNNEYSGDRDPDTPQDSVDQGGQSASASVRRRISRACDQCNQLRTKCDGKQPCAHCVGELCNILREDYGLMRPKSSA